MRGMARRAASRWERKSTSEVASQSASGMSMTGPVTSRRALFTRMSSLPAHASIFSERLYEGVLAR